MTLTTQRLIAALGALAIVAPVASADAKPGPKAPKDKPDKVKTVTYVFKGTFTAADGTVAVKKGNAHARKAGLVGSSVAFDFTSAKLTVADVNGDGKRDLADVQDGDKVLVQARLPRRQPGEGPFKARKLVDQTRAADGGEPDYSASGPAA
jgi:hypothetical protein